MSQNSRWSVEKWLARKVARLPRRAVESTPRPKGRWVCEARRHALPVCGSDNPRRFNFSPCRVLKMGGNARVAQERREGREGWWREGEVCSLVTCGVLFGARRWARARRRCVPRRVSAKAKARRLKALPTSAINTLERVLRHQGRSASSQRQRKSSRWQQRAHVCAVLRRFDNTSLNGYQPLVVIPPVSTRMSAAAPGKTKRIVTTATHNGSIAVAGAQIRALRAFRE